MSEWKEWCEEGARVWGYELVECGSVGFLGRRDPYGRSTTAEGGGTLTAVFRRIETRDRVVYPPLRLIAPTQHTPPAQHKLIATHNHPTHPLSGKPSPPSIVLECIRSTFSTSPENELRLDELWLSNGLDAKCGGMTRALIDALLLPPPPSPPGASPSTSSSSTPSMQSTSTTPPELEWEITQGNPADPLTWLLKWMKWAPPPTSSSSLTSNAHSRPYVSSDWWSSEGTKWEDGDDDGEGEEYISLAEARREMDDGEKEDWTLKNPESEMMEKVSGLWDSWGDSTASEEASNSHDGWGVNDTGGSSWGAATPTSSDTGVDWGVLKGNEQ